MTGSWLHRSAQGCRGTHRLLKEIVAGQRVLYAQIYIHTGIICQFMRRPRPTSGTPRGAQRRSGAPSTTIVRVESHRHEHGRAKLELAARVNGVLDSRGLNQIEAGRLLGMSQPKISALRNYKLRGISLERLLEVLADLGEDVEIVVSSSGRTPRTPVPA